LQPSLHALNVGRGDCFFLEIPTGNGVSVVLIDGGDDCADRSIEPHRYARSRGWTQIDLMILTHIHPDHLTGLLEVAEHLPIREAVLPYPALPLPEGEMRHPKAVQTVGLLRMYERLQLLLRRQNTRIAFRPPFGDQAVYRFGDCVLRHLDPVDKRHLPAYETLEQLKHAPVESQERLCAAFDGQSNGDSSVWLLEDGQGEQLLLLAGDALLPNLERIAQRERIQPRVFKVGHHGMLDAWNEPTLRSMRPDWILITNHAREYEMFEESWRRIAHSSNSGLYVTGSDPGTLCLTSRLPHKPERIELHDAADKALSNGRD